MTTETSEVCLAALGGGVTLSGLVWAVPARSLTATAVAAADDAYRARNTGKIVRINVFKNVQYGIAPVGELRYRPGQAYTYAAGTHTVNTWPSPAHQRNLAEGDLEGRPDMPLGGAFNTVAKGARESEDCLRMIVMIPRGTPPASGWPTVIIFHPGGFGLGANSNSFNLAHRLAAEGVAVFAPNYRLAELGHVHHPDLEALGDWDGPSLALGDQRLAMQWVTDNGAAFGCDVTNRTIAGWSAGAASVLFHAGDPTVSSLYDRGYLSGGGGTERYWDAGISEGNEGYERRFERQFRMMAAGAGAAQDYTDPTRTVADAIAADGEFVGLQKGLSPELALSVSNRRTSIGPEALIYDTAGYYSLPHDNFYPLGDSTHAPNGGALGTAKADGITKPLWINVAGSEATGLVAGFTEGVAHTFARRLGIFDYEEFKSLAWVQALPIPAYWSELEEHGRILYGNAVFQFPAWRIAKAMEANGRSVRLTVFNAAPTGLTYASHTCDLNYVLGTESWRVLLDDDGFPNVDAYLMELGDAYRRAFVNYCASGDPDTPYGYTEGFNLFASPTNLSIPEYDSAAPYDWTVIGSTSTTDATSSPVQATQFAWFEDAMTEYLSRLG